MSLLIFLVFITIGLFQVASCIGRMYCFNIETCPKIIAAPDIPGVDSVTISPVVNYKHDAFEFEPSTTLMTCPFMINVSDQVQQKKYPGLIQKFVNDTPGIFNRAYLFFDNLGKLMRFPTFRSDKEQGTLATVTRKPTPSSEKLNRLYDTFPSYTFFITIGLILTICGIYPSVTDYFKIVLVVYIMANMESFRKIFEVKR